MKRSWIKRTGFKRKGDAAQNSLSNGSSGRRSGRSTLSGNGTMNAIRKTRPDSEARIKQELTKLTSLIVRMRDRCCVLCGSVRELQNGHCWHRDLPPTEFDLVNCNALCARCNNRHEYRPEEYTEWMREKLGEIEFARLDRRAHGETKLGYVELWNLRETYKLLFKELNAMREVA